VRRPGPRKATAGKKNEEQIWKRNPPTTAISLEAKGSKHRGQEDGELSGSVGLLFIAAIERQ
jgi:hypothetical protein